MFPRIEATCGRSPSSSATASPSLYTSIASLYSCTSYRASPKPFSSRFCAVRSPIRRAAASPVSYADRHRAQSLRIW